MHKTPLVPKSHVLFSAILSPIMSWTFKRSSFYVILFFLSFRTGLCVENLKIGGFQPQERDALILLRDSMSSSADLHGNWTGPPCIGNFSRWFGINCSNWHVVDIVLEGIQLVGSLPPTFLQNITFLRQLDFKNNSISGMLPNLTNLVFLENVSLSFNHFSGPIPLEYVELPNLRALELEENYLEGQIPPFDQPSLTIFNVSYNHLRGPIPQTDALLRFPNSSFDDNSDLCGKPLNRLCPAPAPRPVPPFAPPPVVSPPSPSLPENKKNKIFQVKYIAVIAAAAALVFLLFIIAFLCYNKRMRQTETTRESVVGYGFGAWAQKILSYTEGTEDPETIGQLEIFNKEIPVFDLDDLLRATAGVLGKGELGITYKATLETGGVVAVKKLNHMNGLSRKEFLQQMQLLGKLKHENLVETISFYYSEEEKLVIYEYISNGTLFELLHESRGLGRVHLDWATRLYIIKDIAKGLDFLHHSLSSHKVPHANLKSSNVLVHQHNNSCSSKLTNYGFLPLLPSRKHAQKLAISKSPEFVEGKKLTHKTDVYCLGIIILEIITGKIPGEILGEVEETTGDLSEWVRTVVNNDWSTDILDVEILAAKEGHDVMLKLTDLALQCTDMAPETRPRMSEVLRRIEEIEQTKIEDE